MDLLSVMLSGFFLELPALSAPRACGGSGFTGMCCLQDKSNLPFVF